MDHRIKRSLSVILVLSMGMAAAGQGAGERGPSERPSFSQRLFFGGSFGLQLGTITNIDLAPIAGVWLLPRVAAGAGPSFQYYKDPYGATAIYGGRALIQLTLIQDLNNILPLGLNLGIFATGEYEGLSLEKEFFSITPASDGRLYYDSFLVGAGLSQPTGMRSSMNITFLWCITGNDYGIYDSPEIRIEFYF
jgi:hypothetical protein